jgi:hypothetical protein
MQDVVFADVSIRYLLITYTLGCITKREVLMNKEIATEEMEGNMALDLNHGRLQTTYEILPVYVTKSRF